MADVGRYTLELERLETCPAQKRCVCGDELAKVLGEPLVHSAALRLQPLRGGEALANHLVFWPVCLLAIC